MYEQRLFRNNRCQRRRDCLQEKVAQLRYEQEACHAQYKKGQRIGLMDRGKIHILYICPRKAGGIGCWWKVLQEMNHQYKKGTRNALCHVNQTRFISDAGLPMSRLELGKEAVALLNMRRRLNQQQDTLRSLALCQTRAVQEASNAMVLVTDQAASESDRIRSAVNVADADTRAAKGSSSSTTIQLQFHCTFIFLYQCSYY